MIGALLTFIMWVFALIVGILCTAILYNRWNDDYWGGHPALSKMEDGVKTSIKLTLLLYWVMFAHITITSLMSMM